MLNIGIVTTWHEGGAGNVSRAYMETLQAQGHAVYIYARGGQYFPKGNQYWDMDNVTWGKRYVPPRLTGFNAQYIKMSHFIDWLTKKSIDLLIFNEEHSFLISSRIKKLGYVLGAYIDYYKKDTVKLFSSYDFLLCNTRRHYSVFKDFSNCYYYGWGTNVSLYKPCNRGDRKASDHVVFFHSAGYGGINCRKGTDLVVRAFQKITGNATLIVHSQVSPEKFACDIAALIRADSRIKFIEKTVSAPGLYSLGDVFVYPSRLEGIGLCVAEALASGLPVITADCAPMNEFVLDGANGFLVRIDEVKMRADGYYWPEQVVSVDDLASKMQAYVDHADLLHVHARNARAGAELRLDWRENSKDLGRVLEGLVASRGGDSRRRPTTVEQILWRGEALWVVITSGLRAAIKSLSGCTK